MFCILFLAPTVTPVSIGLQMTEYSVIEPENYQFVCAEVQSGDVAGRDIEIDFVVEDSGIVTSLESCCSLTYTYYTRWCYDSEWNSAVH